MSSEDNLKSKFLTNLISVFLPRFFFSMPLFTIILIILLYAGNSFSQNSLFPQESIFEKGEREIWEKQFVNSPDWRLVQELKMMKASFPNGADVYDQQINEIMQRNNPAYLKNSILTFNNQNTPKVLTANEVYRKQNENAFQPKYEDPNKNNPNKNFINPNSPRYDEQLVDLLKFTSPINKTFSKSGRYNTPEYKADLANFQYTSDFLKDMLSGKKPISIADAMYAEESAYGNLQMNYEEYKNEIARCKAFILLWMMENKLNPQNQESIHLAIQKFMGDTLTITNNRPDNLGGLSIPNSHIPYFYDYIDYSAEKDFHNYFLTKTLATGTGQCNTLPSVSCACRGIGSKCLSVSFPSTQFYQVQKQQRHN